jgi:hypothetical protein
MVLISSWEETGLAIAMNLLPRSLKSPFDSTAIVLYVSENNISYPKQW